MNPKLVIEEEPKEVQMSALYNQDILKDKECNHDVFSSYEENFNCQFCILEILEKKIDGTNDSKITKAKAKLLKKLID